MKALTIALALIFLIFAFSDASQNHRIEAMISAAIAGAMFAFAISHKEKTDG